MGGWDRAKKRERERCLSKPGRHVWRTFCPGCLWEGCSHNDQSESMHVNPHTHPFPCVELALSNRTRFRLFPSGGATADWIASLGCHWMTQSLHWSGPGHQEDTSFKLGLPWSWLVLWLCQSRHLVTSFNRWKWKKCQKCHEFVSKFHSSLVWIDEHWPVTVLQLASRTLFFQRLVSDHLIKMQECFYHSYIKLGIIFECHQRVYHN